MIADGVLENPRPDAVFGIHLWTPLPLGTVGVAAGPMMAAVDEFRIEVTGREGTPHRPTRRWTPSSAPLTSSRRCSPSSRGGSRRSRPPSSRSRPSTAGSAFNVLPSASS